MSVSDPLIREIKEWTSKFLENYNINVPITDANINLQPFCACVEKIFMKGLVPQYNTIGIAKKLHAWVWLDKIKPNNKDRFSNSEKAIVINVDPTSVAAENGNIEVGDVLDELNGVHLCLSARGKLNKIRNKAMRKPVTLKIVKIRYTDTGDLYPPLIPMLRAAKLDPEVIRDKYTSKIKNETIKSQNSSAGVQVTYVGYVSTGTTGNVKEIERAIKIMIKSHSHKDDFGPKLKKVKKNVSFEIGEIGVKVLGTEKGDVVLQHSYMAISSCGTVSTLKHYFAYIAGEDNCDISQNFTCYIFYSKCDEHIFTILQSIGQGFQRTHYAV